MSAKFYHRPLTAILLTTTAIHAPAAWAQSTSQFAIPAQPMADALTLFSRQAGVQIFFPAQDIAGLRNPPVAGRMSRQQALSKLIAGSPLALRKDDGKTVILGKSENRNPPVSQADSDIVVTGTRDRGQTTFTALSPVDSFSREQARSTVTSRLDETLTSLVPGFAVRRLPASDGPEFIRPATMNGLDGDKTLVMLNGKRFHRSAFLNSGGTQAVDLAQIPNFAIGKLEVLRDGASAQYGSDAIAGVINVMLDKKAGFSAYAQGSTYTAGDGVQGQGGLHYGYVAGNGGHLALTAEYTRTGATSRSAQRPDAITFTNSTGIAVNNPVQRWGNPSVGALKFAVDAALPVSETTEAYSFATAGQSHGWADINWRNPSTQTSVYKTVAAFPGWNASQVYANGFTPSEGIKARDIQSVAGLRGGKGQALTWDLAASYGSNATNFYLNHSINASLGPNSPTNFYLGRNVQQEFNLTADAVCRWDTGVLPAPVNIAFGAERRVETFRIRAGEYASYVVGAGAAYGLAGGANGFPGFAPNSAGSWSQKSYAGYLDIEAKLAPIWTVEAALRDENFDSFGNNFTYKLASRLELAKGFALRGSYATGFKAPTPAQLYSTSTTQGLDTTTLLLYTNGRLGTDNPVARYFGAKALTPETSKTMRGGLVWKAGRTLSGSVDAFQINVDNRFSLSSTYTLTSALKTQLVATGLAQAADYTAISFFTNDYSTRTRGVDFNLAYLNRVGPGDLNASLALSFIETKAKTGSVSASATTRILFEQRIPKQNAVINLGYKLGRWQVNTRARYYGPWTDSSGNATGDIFQRFGGITFFDASLAFRLNDKVQMKLGAENLLDTYPAKATYQASRGIVYSRNAPYDTNGANIYGRLDLTF
jgi:iron complex outermembrane receptor protein